MKRLLILLTLVIATCLAAPMIVQTGYAGNWIKKSVPAEGGKLSMVLDRNGNPHIFHTHYTPPTQTDLMHSWFDGRQWQTEKLDTFQNGTWSSAVLDQEGKIHLAYVRYPYSSMSKLVYAVFDGETWESTIIESGGHTPTIAIGPDGSLHIVHVTDNAGALRYLSFDGSSWTGERIGSYIVQGNIGTSLAFLPDGTPVVAWKDWDPSKVHVALREGETWKPIGVFDGEGAGISIDRNGTIHLVYNGSVQNGIGQYVYARYDGTQWNEELLTRDTGFLEKETPGLHVAPSGGAPKIAVDDEGRTHVVIDLWIVNKKTGSSHLIYGFLDKAGWHSEELTQARWSTGIPCQLVLNPQGVPSIAFARTRIQYCQFKGKKLSLLVKGNGSVISLPGGDTCENNCSDVFFPGASVTVTAVPSPGAEFLGWSGDCKGSDSTCTLVMDRPRKITATFGP